MAYRPYVPIFERAICNIIYPEIKELISSNQYGFVQRRFRLWWPDRRYRLYLDFTKAFDLVPHHLLIHKLRTFGFNGRC